MKDNMESDEQQQNPQTLTSGTTFIKGAKIILDQFVQQFFLHQSTEQWGRMKKTA